jgi:hypothetical protein
MFQLDESQSKRLLKWLKEQEVKAEEMQGKKPYYGCSGGVLTYMFTPTTIGLVVKVEHGYTKETIDLSDYDSW